MTFNPAASELTPVVGQTIRAQISFRNGSGTLTDPTTVTAKIGNPAGVTATYIYGAPDGRVIRESTGVYHIDQILDMGDVWYFRLIGAGVVDAADQTSIYCFPAKPS